MRSYLSGPHIGPLHTVLWSSHPRRRGATPYRGWLFFYFAAILGTVWAWVWQPWAGITVLAIVLASAALSIYGTIAAHREMAARGQPQPRSASYTDRNGRKPTRRRRRSEMRARAASRP